MEFNKVKDKKMLQMMLWNATVGKVQELCSLDSRSLALLRVAVGITSLYDLYDRARDISAHYSDSGIISRNVVLNSLWSDYWFSLHMMTGNVNYISILFIVHTIIATSFLIGYRTRLSHVLLWVFTISLQTRNIIVGHSGDTLHVLVLLWMAFLPISKNWSVDAMLDPKNHNNRKTSNKNYVVTNVGAVAFMFQILVMYYAAHTLKVGSAWRIDRTAAYLALGLDFFRRPFGDILLMFPNILKLSTIGVLYWQMIGPYLYFSPIFTGFCRSFVVFGFSCMHWGFGLAMRLGQFSFITCSGILGLFPGWGWEKMFNFFRTKRRVGFQLYYLQQCKACYWFARMCETFLLLPDSHVRAVTSLRSEEDPCSCGGTCEKDDQIWLSCQNYNGQFLYNFDALRELCYASPFLVPLSFIDFNKLLKFRALYKPAALLRDYIHGGCHSEGSWASVNSSNSKKFNKLNDDIVYQVISMTYQVMRALIKNTIAAVFLYIIFTRNASSVGSRNWNTPSSLYPLMYIFHLDQHWAMFTPSPPNQWWWYNIEGELGDHTKVELWANGAMFTHIPNIPHTFDKPPNNEVYLGFKNHRWFKFFENGYNHHQSYETFRLEFGRWICREYNNAHYGNQRLWKFNVHLMNEIDNNQHDGSRTFTGKQTLWSHLCYDQ